MTDDIVSVLVLPDGPLDVGPTEVLIYTLPRFVVPRTLVSIVETTLDPETRVRSTGEVVNQSREL